ncbi:hypothetical protein [Actinomadura rubrisoli]|uniref:Uncharacterized protein n=1 Tax=Actinomadura rubrisoli TaxID=2530368 RepID=A0A4R4ZZW4_9ACTN|nr:hypothetical protein [Actinomadura rubrisoli]TDD65048.1 hypothetical protein E1298_41735 [Actinomadura rubrisoli]
MGILEFDLEGAGTSAELHIQCPFRVLHDEQLVLGSDDMSYPGKRRSDSDAEESYKSMFDRKCAALNKIIEEAEPRVMDIDLRSGGALELRLTLSLQVQVFPDCSGKVEMWRFFVRGDDDHTVYPPDLFTP